MKKQKNKQNKCSICEGAIEEKVNPLTGEVYWRGGNNAQPINDGRCCDTCNDLVVLPERIKQMMEAERK